MTLHGFLTFVFHDHGFGVLACVVFATAAAWVFADADL
jgi:hypothetical protein